MENLLIHLIKSSAILFLFLTCYHFFLKQETFYSKNRGFLIIGLLSALLLPLFPFIKTTIIAASPAINYSNLIINNLETTPVAKPFDWQQLLLWVYFLGVVAFTIKLFIQLISIGKLIRESEQQKNDGYKHVVTPKKIAPFSFFKYIFYNPQLLKNKELNTIIEHEKIHAKEYHTIDILLSEITLILQWYNPVIWLYKKAIKQNLEFQADYKTLPKNENKKYYQYLLLKEAIGIENSSITNSFYNSLIKKRIVMLNQKQSKKINLLKLLTVLPLLGIFLVSFNTKEVVQVETEEDNQNISTSLEINEATNNSDTAVLANYTVTSNVNTTNRKSIIQKQAVDKNITLVITKNTSDEGLLKIKKDLAKKDIDFSYTAVHNEKGEISSISIQVSGERNGEKFNSSYNTNSDDVIKPITISIDEDNNVSMGNSNVTFDGDFDFSIHEDHDVHVDIDEDENIHIDIDVDVDEDSDVDVIRVRSRNRNNMTWVSHDDDDDDHEDIVITNTNGKEVITVNGKKLSKKEAKAFKKNKSIHSSVIETNGKDRENVFIIKTSDDDHNVKVIKKNKNMFFIDKDSDNPPLFIIDGKEASKKEFKKLSEKNIETIDTNKGDDALAKYGEKAKNGVIEITTKKKK